MGAVFHLTKKMNISLSSVLACLLLASLGWCEEVGQKCDIAIRVKCPDNPENSPTVWCPTVQCAVTTTKTWFVGALYKRVDCLEEYEQMVKVEYQKQGKISCGLVPLQTNTELLEAYKDSQSCE